MSPRSIIFFLNQNDIVLVKKSQRVATKFFSSFFLQLGPVLAPGRPGNWSTHQAGPGFKTMVILILTLTRVNGQPDP